METKEKKELIFEDISAFISKKLEDKSAKKEKDKTREIIRKELIIERDLTGLYFTRYDGGGPIPEILKGKFTSIQKLEDTIKRYQENK